jgi:hypothetical protein
VVRAASTSGTIFRTAHVKRLKEIAAETGSTGRRICKFAGPDATRWQQILEIVAPDTTGCEGHTVPWIDAARESARDQRKTLGVEPFCQEGTAG